MFVINHRSLWFSLLGISCKCIKLLSLRYFFHKMVIGKIKPSRKSKLVNSAGIIPVSIFDERSNDSIFVKFPMDLGIGQVSLLWERLSPLRS